MFPTHFDSLVKELKEAGRNPLKSGQCFLLQENWNLPASRIREVAIPSNRVNVPYLPLIPD